MPHLGAAWQLGVQHEPECTVFPLTTMSLPFKLGILSDDVISSPYQRFAVGYQGLLTLSYKCFLCPILLCYSHCWSYMLKLICLPHLISSKLSRHLLFPDLCFVQHPSSTITSWKSYPLKSRIAALTTAASKEQTQLRLSLLWHHPGNTSPLLSIWLLGKPSPHSSISPALPCLTFSTCLHFPNSHIDLVPTCNAQQG